MLKKISIFILFSMFLLSSVVLIETSRKQLSKNKIYLKKVNILINELDDEIIQITNEFLVEDGYDIINKEVDTSQSKEPDSKDTKINKKKAKLNDSSKQEIKETPIVTNDNKKKSETNKIEESSIITIKSESWEELGISEDDYYNKPMWSWQKLTHNNLDSCRIDGISIIDDDSNNYTQYWCYEVISYSGSTLGYMLRLET